MSEILRGIIFAWFIVWIIFTTVLAFYLLSYKSTCERENNVHICIINYMPKIPKGDTP